MSMSDINKLIMGLETETGLPVELELYTGPKTSFIIFSWITKSPEYFGDDIPLYDTNKVNVVLYTPRKFNASALITQIRDYLEKKGFTVTNIWGPNLSPLGDSSKSEYNLQTVFETVYTDSH